MEHIKRGPYKPKETKIEKLKQFYDKVKKPVKCEFFTKTSKILAILLLLTSCSAEWHLKQAIKKNPNILKPQVVKIDTLIVRDSFVKLDSFVAHEIDTIKLDNQKSQIVIYKNKNKFIVKTKIKSDTIRFTKTITLDKIITKCDVPWWLYAVVIISILIIAILLKK